MDESKCICGATLLSVQWHDRTNAGKLEYRYFCPRCTQPRETPRCAVHETPMTCTRGVGTADVLGSRGNTVYYYQCPRCDNSAADMMQGLGATAVAYEYCVAQEHPNMTDNQYHPGSDYGQKQAFAAWVTKGWEVVSVTVMAPINSGYMCRAVGVLRRVRPS